MDILLERKAIASLRQLGRAVNYCEANTEAVVPDTQGDIGRVLTSEYINRIRSKDVDSGRVSVRGELDVTVMYVPDSENSVSIVKATLPYSADFAVPEADSSCLVTADISVSALDVIVLNPRKVLIKAEMCVAEECFKSEENEVFDRPTESTKGVYFRSKSAEINYVNHVDEKSFVIEAEYPVADGAVSPQRVIASRTSFTFDSSDRVGSKLIIKGTANMLLYLSSESGAVETAEYASQFSQLFDLPEGNAETDYKVTFLSTGEYYDISDGYIKAELHAAAQLISRARETISFVDDAYGCAAKLELDTAEVAGAAPRRELTVRDNITLDCDTEAEIQRVISVRPFAGRLLKSETGYGAPVSAEIVYADAGGLLRSCKLRGDLSFSPELEDGETVLSAEICISDARAVPAGNCIDLRITAQLRLETVGKSQLKTICSVSWEADDCCEPSPSVYMLRADNGRLWDVAKKYRSDVEAIKTVNGITGDEDIAGKMLIVPIMK